MRKDVILPCYAVINKDESKKIMKNRVICIKCVPPTGIEPVHPPPEGGALSPELRGLMSMSRLSAGAVISPYCQNERYEFNRIFCNRLLLGR